jgi:LysM repeat protein
MIRPITVRKPPPPPRVDPKVNAEQTTRLQAEATKLRNEIRLANKMGKSDAAASARQRLTQVNAELSTAQAASPAVQPAPVQPAAAPAAPQGNGGTTFPALFTTQNFGGTPNLVLAHNKPDVTRPSPEAATASDIVKDIDGGKSIDIIAEERGMTPDKVVAALNAGGMEATTSEAGNGDTRTIEITDGSGRTITEHQDYQHGNYYTEVKGPNGQTTSSPIRDGLGRTETTSVDPETGAITTKYVDDLGDGDVTERTSNPKTGITTTTHTDGNGGVTVTKTLPNRVTVETVTPAGGPSLPVTTVTGADGKKTVLAHTQAADGSGAPSIQEQLAEGKSIDEIAKERGLTPEQVIAELNAAGLDVTRGGAANGETISTTVTDPHSGKKVTYNHDYEHGSRSVTTVEGNTETTDTIDGNGRTSHTVRNTQTGESTTTIIDPKNHTETKIVFDKDGRRTETITETLNDGKPINYEVKPGDNLTKIAEEHGVSLEDLAKSNLELFNSPRDPDLIHPGETVVVEGGTKTTVNVTFNGYTLTTHPDGNMTLRNNGEGTELKLESGSALEGLAGLLMDVNPNSSDPEKAKEGQAIKTAVEMILYDENRPDLGATAEQREKETLDAVEEYGIGNPGEKTPGVAGARPQGKAPSGGDWVQARGLWVDPHIARAMAAEDVAKSALIEVPAKIRQLSAQLDVYALDPAYKGAMRTVDARMDEVLAPYGLQWTAPEPKGTLADAQGRLTEADNRLKEASGATAEYQEAVEVLDRAIRQQEYAAQFPDGTHPVAVAADSDYNYQEEVRKGNLARADANALFAQASAHTSKGDKLLADYEVATLTTAHQQVIDKHGAGTAEAPKGTLKEGEQPVEIEVAGRKLQVAPEVAAAYEKGDRGAIAASGKAVRIEIDGQWKWVHPEVAAATIELDAAKKQQSHADKNLGVAQAYSNVAVTGQEMAEFDDLKARLIEQYRLENPDLFIPDEEYSTAGGDYRGKVTSREVIEKDGDLYLVTKFEHGEQENQLTSISGDKNDPESARNNPLNGEWRELWYGSSAQACGTDGLAANGGLEGLKKAQIAAGEEAKNAEIARFDLGIEDINTEITSLTEARNAAVTEHGGGTVDAPAGTLPPGVAPVEITVDGRKLQVAPDVAEAYNQGKPGALIDGVTAVRIEIDGQWKWVHPEVAAAEIELDAAEQEKKGLEENRQIAVVARDGYSFALKQPVKIFADEESAAKEEGRLRYAYLENDRDKALANYQLQFKDLYEQGYTEDFRQVKDLSSEVTKIFDLDTNTEEGRDSLEKITEEVRDIAGENASIRVVPMFFVDETTAPQKVVLLAVKDGDGVRYVDVKGGAYGNVEEFQDNNDIFGEEGKLILPKDFSMTPGGDGSIALDVIQPREFSTWETIIDPIVGIGTGLATIASFTPLAPVAAPLAYAGGTYLATRAVIKQVHHLKYGGEWGEVESLMNVATVATTALPMGSSMVRTVGLARTGMSGGKAFAGSLGISRSADDGFLSFGRYGQRLPSSQQLASAMQTMRTAPGGLKWAAWTMDAGAMALGAPLLYVSAKDLLLHGSEMSGLELANAITGLASGVTGTGLGLRGLKTMFPGRGGQTTSLAAAPAPTAPGANGQPRPNPGSGHPNGPAALPTGAKGAPPPGGKSVVTNDGQSSQPMVVYETDAGGVYRPTNKLSFHDPRHRVIEGTATNVHDEGTAKPGERGDPESASDRSAQGTRDQNVREPADGDPIIVRTVVHGDAQTAGSKNGGLGRLVWDPATKTFTGMPKPDAGEYIYASGKDLQQSAYLDGVRPGDPMVKFTPEEILIRSETESRNNSSRETNEGQGPLGVELPETSLQIRDENGQPVTVTYLGPLPKSAEKVYVPPADGPRLRGDDPAVAHKSHILVRDPETGEPFVLPWVRGASEDHVPGSSGRPDNAASSFDAAMQALGAGPQRKMIEAAPPTTYTLEQVRRMRQPDKWKAGELYTRELNRSPGEEHFKVVPDPTGPHPVIGDGGRFVDAPVRNARGDIEAIEVKTYHRWTTINGKGQMREVPLTAHLQQQINKDVALRASTPGYEPRWVFLDAPPSSELQKALDDAGIVGNIMGHSKPSKTEAQANAAPPKNAAEEASSAPILTGAERVANREEALQLFDGMIAQDLKIPDVPIVDIADQFSRSPTLMNLLRAAHGNEVRIVNTSRPEFHIQTADGHDVSVRGASYDHQTRTINVDGEVSKGPISRDDAVAEHVRVLSHELSHFKDAAFPKPADFSHEGAFTRAYVDARLQNEGRARLVEFVVSDELSANGGQPLKGLDDGAFAAEKAVFEDFKAGRIDEATAIRQLGDLFRNKIRSDANLTYGEFYTRSAGAVWSRPAVEGSGLDAFGRPAGLDGASAAPATNPGSANPSGKLTRDGVRATPLDQVQNLDMADFQPNQVGWLTREQVAKLTGQQFRDMDRLGLLPHLTKSQLRGIPKARIGDLNVAGLTAQQIPWLTNGQVGKLSEQQFRDLSEAGLHRHLTKPQLQAIPADRIGFLDVSTLGAPQVGWLKPKQVANLTEKQLGDMSESGVLALLSKEQLRAVPETTISAINPSKLDAKQVPWLTDGQVAQLAEKQLQALGEAGLLKHVTQSQLRAIPDTKIGAIDVTKFDPAQVPWLTRKQIAKLTEQQFKDLGETGLLKNFTENQVKAIPAERLDVAKLDPKQVPWLTDKQVAALTRDQWGAFTVNHIEGLTRPQIEAMKPEQFEELSPGQFRKFTLEQFEWMSTDQANALSVLQLTTFKAAYKKTMTPDQRTLVEGALVSARAKEYQVALDTFGTMAGSSYMLWSSLPPHWTATAGGVAFALRGAVFSVQSIFPNATASHTKLGRALNLASGLSFIASSPGAAAPLIQSGSNPPVNVTFTLGNMIYGTKSTLQAFTGRTAMRLLGDHAGNFFYLSGSIVYTVQNLHSPLGWISGGLFTLGSAEFWASAIRTDVTNRKPAPRTDAQIAAAAKSDKRWATWDRIALGVTFGIGMFLFAWDTLDGQPWKVDATDGKNPPKPDDASGPDDDATGPDDGPDDPKEPPEQFPQLVVLSEDGLNLRVQPDDDSQRVTVLESGTFVKQTGQPSTESPGHVWIPVEGFGADGESHSGWVAGEYVEPHPEGASNSEGRKNPKLEQNGYQWVEVRDGDSIRVIAVNHSVDVAETVVLNMDHIVSSDVIFAGDRIYLPATAVG